MLRNCSSAIAFFQEFFPWLYAKGIYSFTLEEISRLFNNQERTMKGYLTYYMRNSSRLPVKLHVTVDTEHNINLYTLSQS